MPTACVEAPIHPTERSGSGRCHGVANIHIDLAAGHSDTFLPVRGRSVRREDPAAFHDAARLPESQESANDHDGRSIAAPVTRPMERPDCAGKKPRMQRLKVCASKTIPLEAARRVRSDRYAHNTTSTLVEVKPCRIAQRGDTGDNERPVFFLTHYRIDAEPNVPCGRAPEQLRYRRWVAMPRSRRPFCRRWTDRRTSPLDNRWRRSLCPHFRGTRRRH